MWECRRNRSIYSLQRWIKIDGDREEEEKDSGERIVLEMKEGAPPAAPVHRKMALQILRHIIMK